MRKIFLFMHVSLDGYFEAPGHDISWSQDFDFEAYSNEQSQEVDTLLFGHRTYDMMKNFWPTPQGQATMPEIAKFMNETRKVVVSHKSFEPGWNNVAVICDDAVAAIKQLKEQPGKSIAIFGSNNLCVSLIPEGLIDEFQIVVNPVVLGEGTSLFQGLPNKADLILMETRKFKSGAIMLTYVPKEA